MNNEKIQINVAPEMPTVEVILREGEAPRQLEPKAPLKTNLEGVIGCVAEYLEKRINTGQFEQKDCHILVNRDRVDITLLAINHTALWEMKVMFIGKALSLAS